MARIGTGAVVTTLTASALALVTVLALQAKSSANVTSAASGKPGASVSTSAGASSKASASPKPAAVPAHSGTGKRVVYSLGAKRVWLVEAAGSVSRTFTVQPSTLSPSVGTYNVYAHSSAARTGSDGVEIKNVVIFAERGSTVFGFSSATDGTTPAPDPAKKTGGIRETLGDGQALYDFTVVSSKVVVVA